MSSVARRGWQRVKSSLADEVEARVAGRDAELVRQMGDVFKELAHISVDIGAVWRSVEELRGRLEAQATALAELLSLVGDLTDVDNESTELLGRLVQSARARLDVLEGASQKPS